MKTSLSDGKTGGTRPKDPHELKSVYGDKDYAATQKELHAELDRLRKELKLPENDPPASLIPRKP
jgi:hypothetical protein